MQNPTDRAAATRDLDDLISEAYAATGILPTIDRCQHLHDALRPAIGLLAEQVRIRQNYLARDTTGWQRCERALLQAQGALLGNFGIGLRSAALHVQVLGEAVEVLRDCIRETG